MAKDAVVSDELAKKFATEKDTPYLRWVRGEGLDIIGAHYVRNLRTAELKPWVRREGKGVFETLILGDLADIVAVVEGRDTHVLKGDHRLDMFAHRGAGSLFDGLRIAFALFFPLRHRPALRQIAVDRIVSRGLVGDHEIGRAHV